MIMAAPASAPPCADWFWPMMMSSMVPALRLSRHRCCASQGRASVARSVRTMPFRGACVQSGRRGTAPDLRRRGELEAIAAVLVDQQHGTTGVLLHLAAQAVDVGLHGMRARIVAVAPNLAQEGLTRDGTAIRLDQEPEDLDLLAGQRNAAGRGRVIEQLRRGTERERAEREVSPVALIA